MSFQIDAKTIEYSVETDKYLFTLQHDYLEYKGSISTQNFRVDDFAGYIDHCIREEKIKLIANGKQFDLQLPILFMNTMHMVTLIASELTETEKLRIMIRKQQEIIESLQDDISKRFDNFRQVIQLAFNDEEGRINKIYHYLYAIPNSICISFNPGQRIKADIDYNLFKQFIIKNKEKIFKDHLSDTLIYSINNSKSFEGLNEIFQKIYTKDNTNHSNISFRMLFDFLVQHDYKMIEFVEYGNHGSVYIPNNFWTSNEYIALNSTVCYNTNYIIKVVPIATMRMVSYYTNVQDDCRPCDFYSHELFYISTTLSPNRKLYLAIKCEKN